eukprot:Nk52_evm22s239 gene=Nk52_evmTU22s239
MFQEDKIVKELSIGVRRDVWGLNLTTLWPGDERLRAQYARLVQALKDQVPEAAECCYFYPFETLHCTISTFVNFKKDLYFSKKGGNGEEVDAPALAGRREACLEEWKNAVEKSIEVERNRQQEEKNEEDKDNRNGESQEPKPLISGSFEVEYSSIVLASAAGFMRLLNPTDNIASVREAIDKHAKSFVSQNLLDNCTVSSPNIIHCTFMRFISVPKDADRFREKFESICSQIWEPFNVRVSEMYVSEEDKPYMHVGLDKRIPCLNFP